MKPNRSSRYTEGLVCTLADSDLRVFFFEVDKEERDEFAGMNEFYNFHKLDFVVHRTGGGGYHWLSPTMISKEKSSPDNFSVFVLFNKLTKSNKFS